MKTTQTFFPVTGPAVCSLTIPFSQTSLCLFLSRVIPLSLPSFLPDHNKEGCWSIWYLTLITLTNVVLLHSSSRNMDIVPGIIRDHHDRSLSCIDCSVCEPSEDRLWCWPYSMYTLLPVLAYLPPSSSKEKWYWHNSVFTSSLVIHGYTTPLMGKTVVLLIHAVVDSSQP